MLKDLLIGACCAGSIFLVAFVFAWAMCRAAARADAHINEAIRKGVEE